MPSAAKSVVQMIDGSHDKEGALVRQGLSLQTHKLTKTFGEFTAVENINIHLEPGESYGFLGPNGAGKTTTLMMVLGIWKPTRGDVLIADQPVRQGAFDLKRKIGVVAEYQSFYEEMSAWEYLMFFGHLYQVDNLYEKAMTLLERLGLEKWRNVLIGGFSTGMKKKLGFARALLHSPQLLVLDEPVSGLDPYGIVQIRELLMDEQNAGCTLLISSHILSEVERTVDRVGILAQGRLLVEDTMNNLRTSVRGTQRLHLSFDRLTEDDVAAFSSQDFVAKTEREGKQLTLWVENGADQRRAIGRIILERGLVVLEMKREEISLEEAFITITENNLNQFTDQLGEISK
jgi:ABC-type multidrug transport system ATPase subunit